MNPIEIWYLLIDGNNSPVLPPTYVCLENTNKLSELKKKIKEESPNTLKKIHANQLTVLRCKDRKMEFDGRMSDILKDQVIRLFANRVDNLEELDMTETIGGLKLLNQEVLPVQMPRYSVPPIVANSLSLGKFDEDDIYENDIRQYSPSRSLPSFVAAYQNKLTAKRLMKDSEFATLEATFGTALCNQYFDHASTTISRSDHSLQFEERGMQDLNFTSNYLWSTGTKEIFVSSLFFMRLLNYLKHLGAWHLSIKLSKAVWPFPLVVRHGCSYYSHTPENDFSIWAQFDFPRMLVKINSKKAKLGQSRPEDYCGLLLEGASIVRQVNQGRKQAGNPPDYVLMVIYIEQCGNARRHILFQLEDTNEVYYTEACDSLLEVEGRLAFAQALYNLGDIFISEAGETYGDFITRVRDEARGMPAFRSNGHSDESDTDEDSPNNRQRQQDEEVQVLEEAGYEVTSNLPRVCVFSYGTFEPLCPIPPRVYSVRRKGDVGGDNYIAKRVRSHSSELKMLRMLDKKEGRCDNIIQLVDTIHSRSHTFIVLPKQKSLSEELELARSRALDGRFIDLSRDLARGMTFIHDNCITHLDINPANLVYTTSYRLQVIDFDIAVQVDSEESQVDIFGGTDGWMAPEIGTEDGPPQLYSPIKADRYSCGLVFMKFAARHTGDDEGLAKFARKLLSIDPNSRPQLAEWCDRRTGVTDDDDETKLS